MVRMGFSLSLISLELPNSVQRRRSNRGREWSMLQNRLVSRKLSSWMKMNCTIPALDLSDILSAEPRTTAENFHQQQIYDPFLRSQCSTVGRNQTICQVSSSNISFCLFTSRNLVLPSWDIHCVHACHTWLSAGPPSKILYVDLCVSLTSTSISYECLKHAGWSAAHCLQLSGRCSKYCSQRRPSRSWAWPHRPPLRVQKWNRGGYLVSEPC